MRFLGSAPTPPVPGGVGVSRAHPGAERSALPALPLSPGGADSGRGVGAGALPASTPHHPPVTIRSRADQVQVGERLIDGRVVLGHEASNLGPWPVVRLALSDGNVWTGAPCDDLVVVR